MSIVPAPLYLRLHPEKLPGNTASVEFAKEYVDQFSDRIKWLETIAYAVLVGIVGLRWSREKLATHSSVAISAGCLVVSLFNGYSAHDQVLQALQVGTPFLLAGTIARFTIICQFWFLAIAVALLAIRLLSVPRSVHCKTLCWLAVFVGATATHAQPGTLTPLSDPQVQSCASDWVKSRLGEIPSQADLTLLGRVVAGTANAKGIALNVDNRCAFSAWTLDHVLDVSVIVNGNRDYSSFLQETQTVARGVINPAAGQSAIVRTLLSLAEIWHHPMGVVDIDSAQAGDQVFIDGNEVGATPLTCAETPGTYDLKVKRNGIQIDDETLKVNDGDKLQIKTH
jgi:PEGA domain-containing protein